MDDAVTYQRAIAALTAARGYVASEADELLVETARRQGRQPLDVARDVLAGLRTMAPSPVALSRTYQEIGEAIDLYPNDLPLRRITEITVAHVDGATWASLTLFHDDTLTTVAATHPSAVAADELQYELGEGPCVTAVSTASAYLGNDMPSGDRFPRFAARAHEQLGVESLLGLRLGLDVDDLDTTIASLNIYSNTARSFTHDAIIVGTLIAAHASTAMIASQYQHRVDHLQRALETNRDIGMAMGVLMNEHKITQDRAFALLRIASQHTNRKLRDIAADVVDTGTLDLPGTAEPPPP